MTYISFLGELTL